MKNQRIALATGLLWMLSGAVGCSSTFQLYVANDTSRPYALRINNFDHAYSLQPSSKHELPDRLQRGRAYTLFALDGDRHQHEHKIMTDSAQLFVHLRESDSGVLEWWVSELPPVE
ncbi:MAG: hypothetical protein IH895_09885 [Planctomycetes bacterium]|nr:hypothetical protein [Planctomycetota bacterium]